MDSVFSDHSPIQIATQKDGVRFDATSGRVTLTPKEARQLSAELLKRATAAEQWGQ